VETQSRNAKAESGLREGDGRYDEGMGKQALKRDQSDYR
jgi:hypothetical protein